MKFLSIDIPGAIHSPEFIGADPVARATWLCVIAYCAEQENGGFIQGAQNWNDRLWQQTCGVTRTEIENSAPLVSFQDGGISVEFYPLQIENAQRRKREGGRLGGLKRAANFHDSQGVLEGNLEAPLEGNLQRKVRESKVKESKVKVRGMGDGAVAPSRADDSAPTPKKKPKRAKTICDADWLTEQAQSTAWSGLDVMAEFERAKVWAETNRRKCSRRFFVNWLNRAMDQLPINASGDKSKYGEFYQ